ncbi:PepSY domain-containing protein [Streptomyces sp. NPDC005266]|uniref:PepSY domain-containing protein n=1 Tax=Streptomyces sp. NPDC005266 TaxID=3154877 RepID=UPI0033AB7793
MSASQAAEKAASRGAVTSVNVDDDRASVWEVEVVRDHKAHDLDVNPHTGKVTQAPSEDGKAEDHDED